MDGHVRGSMPGAPGAPGGGMPNGGGGIWPGPLNISFSSAILGGRCVCSCSYQGSRRAAGKRRAPLRDWGEVVPQRRRMR